MIPFKLNGKKFSMPSSWDEVKYRQYLKTFEIKGDSNYQVVSIFTDIPEETLRKAEINGLEDVLIALSFATKPMETYKYCDKIGPYKLPVNKKGQFDIKVESLAQFEDMRALCNGVKEFKALAEAYPKMIGIYLQKIRDGEYDYLKALEMESEILEIPAREVLTVGSFFLIKLKSLSNGTSQTSQSPAPSPKKQKQVSKGSRKRSGSR